MSMYKDIARNGLWKQNSILAQLLGLCPLLAVSTNMVNAVSLGVATILVAWLGMVPAVVHLLQPASGAARVSP